MTTQAQKCVHCGKSPSGSWCCDKAELQALRAAADQTIRELSSEVTAPLVIADGGAARAILKVARDRLRAARSAAVA